MVRNIILLLMTGCLLAGSSYAQQPIAPTLHLAKGWTYIETDEPCVAVLGERCQVRNERSMWQVFFITVADEDLGFSASYRVDLPPTGIIVGNITEMTKATSFGFSGVTGTFVLPEYKAGYRSKVLTKDDPPFNSFDARKVSGGGTTTSTSKSYRSHRALQLQLLDSGEAAAETEKLFDPKRFPDSYPDWWISADDIAAMKEANG